MGARADDDRAHRRRALEARCRVHDVARRDALALRGARVERDDGLAGVHGRPHGQVELRVLRVQLLDRLEDPQRRTNRPLGVVLVRPRRAEDGHDRVADELLDGAAEALDLLPHPLVVGPQPRADVLRVGAVRAAGEADEVDEEHRHDLPLLRLGGRGRQRGAARPAEAGTAGVVLAARGTGGHGRSLGRHRVGTKRARVAGTFGGVEEARAVLERLERIEALERGGAAGPELLDELRALVREAEEWARLEGDERAAAAVERCGDSLSARILPA